MIPEFNELGNHPTDVKHFVREQLMGALSRLGIEESYPAAEELLLTGVDELLATPKHFTGRHIPTAKTLPVARFLEDTFVRTGLCSLSGGENYETALELIASGQNVVLAPNHTSPLDGLIPCALFRDRYMGTKMPSLVMSQVFEYARITRLLTSGVTKYPVFQPKHMQRFATAGDTQVTRSMQGQNTVTMRALSEDIRQGGQNVFLYLERDRNTEAMGVPEPAAVRVLEMLERAKPGLYILPIHISGAETIFPNRMNVNEIDEFMQIIQIGQGDVVCGEPILFSDILQACSLVNQYTMVEAVMGPREDVLENPKRRRLAAIAITILGLVAKLAPSEAVKGVYQDVLR